MRQSNSSSSLLDDPYETNIRTAKLIDTSGLLVDINDLIMDQKYLILLFSSSSCPPCLNDYLDIFNEIGCEYTGQVFAITNHEEIRNLKILQLRYDCLNFYNQSQDIISINDFRIEDDGIAMLLIENNFDILDFQKGHVVDSISSPFFINAMKNL